MLGSGESGKSTILHQMKIIHANGLSPAELAEYRPIIYKNILDSAHELVRCMQQAGLECMDSANDGLAKKILDYPSESWHIGKGKGSKGKVQDFNIAAAIHQLWNDPVILTLVNSHSDDYHLMELEPYFFEQVLRIGAPGYVPTETDVLRARHEPVGMTETKITMGQLAVRIIDVGSQRSERKKWIHCFEHVTSIIFCTALSEYNQVLLEDKTQNRMTQSLALFESVANSRWFLRTSIILFLTKIDVFKNKLKKVPLERYFPEYTGGPDINKGAKYILWKFMQTNRARLSVYPHLTQASDTTNIQLVFSAVKETINQNALKDSGIL